jgi:hypothetical protein
MRPDEPVFSGRPAEKLQPFHTRYAIHKTNLLTVMVTYSGYQKLNLRHISGKVLKTANAMACNCRSLRASLVGGRRIGAQS